MYLGSFRDFLNGVRAADVAVVDAAGVQLSGFDASRPATATLTTVVVSAVTTLLAASNAARRQVLLVNKSGRKIFVAFAATATTAAWTKEIANNNEWESPLDGYTGDISAITGSGSGDVMVTEVTT